VQAELILRRGTPPDAEYSFKHALVQDAAYSTLLRTRRQQLHGRIATVLESRFPEITSSQPQVIAQHCAEAGIAEKAVSYWLKAGQLSAARSAMSEAVAQFEKGLDLLSRIPENSSRQQQELDLQIGLARALLATRGYAAPAVADAYERARMLAERLDRRDYLPPLLYGLWVFQLTRSELKLSLTVAQQLETFGEERDNLSALLLGKLARGASYFWRGEWTAARALFEQCHGLSDPAHRAVYAAWVAQDMHNYMLLWLAHDLALLGHVDQGRTRLNEALAEARELRHAFTLALALPLAAYFESAYGSPHRAHQYAQELAALSNELGFPFFTAQANLHLGWSLTALGHAQEGVD
jgi:tetratricopeptide (TPR) repeat protein